MNTLKTLTAALVATFAVAAYAGPFGPGAGYGPGAGAGQPGAAHADRLKAADQNGDGLISRSEAQANMPGLATRFDAIDTNKDGNLSTAELDAARATFGRGGRGGRGGGWMQWDANGDGQISREEATARFDAVDTNKDGTLSADEMQAARGARGAGGRGQGFTRWDANGDGMLSRAEVANAPRLSQDFDAIDTNKDGLLTVEELQAAHGQFAGRHGRHGS